MPAKAPQNARKLRRKGHKKARKIRPSLNPGAVALMQARAAEESLLAAALPVTALCEKTIARFCKHARKGIPASTICNYLGIYPGSFHRWVSQGELFFRNAESGLIDHKLALYGFFVKEYRRAVSIYLKGCQLKAEDDDPKSYYRWVIFLERRDRKNWGKNETVTVESDSLQPDERFV